MMKKCVAMVVCVFGLQACKTEFVPSDLDETGETVIGDGDGDGDGDGSPDVPGDGDGDGDGDPCAPQMTCGEDCVDTNSDPLNCGECGRACRIVNGIGGCIGGICLPSWSPCLYLAPDFSCGYHCDLEGESCVESACGGLTAITFNGGQPCDTFTDGTDFVGATCIDLLEASRTATMGRCCCTDYGS